jgi:hypothetical protein
MNDEEGGALSRRSPRRDFPGCRWLTVLLRGVHIVAVVLLGAAAFGSPRFDPHTAGMAVLVTGLAIWALDIWSKPQHLLQWAGLSMFIKLALVALMLLAPALYEPLFWIVVVWSVLFSHAPASFRNAPVFGGQSF